MLFYRKLIIGLMGVCLIHGTVQSAEPVVLPPPPGEGPELPDNLINQTDIENGNIRLRNIIKAGGIVFTTSFNRYDGFGDGPPDIFDDTQVFPFRGDRAPLQNGETPILRINGLGAESCTECHSVVSRATVPPTFGVGGHGGTISSAMAGNGLLDADEGVGVTDGITETTGRFINPPIVFGSGGVELLGKEMTRDLQAIKTLAESSEAGVQFDLTTKGVFFGTVISNGDGSVEIEIENDLSIDEDLVIRPFGRKGDKFTIRDFDREAMAFHFGIQPLDVFDPGTDPDGDGITDELSIGEMSALSVFLATTPRPRVVKLTSEAKLGQTLFNSIGCVMCHIPRLITESRLLTQSYPDVATDPDANIFMSINLAKKPANFKRVKGRGLEIRLYADLKRHNMGPGLAESTGEEIDPFFITAKLWGVADSAPYLHDGRASTLTEAILSHGGEAEDIRNNFAGLADQEKIEVLSFLRSLKVPRLKDIRKLERLIRK